MDISTQHCVECKAKVSSFLFRGVDILLFTWPIIKDSKQTILYELSIP